MKLYPQDLREQFHVKLIRRRSGASNALTENTGTEITPHLGRLGKVARL
ncbi:MAG: hypothetical protein V4671_02375 [Armatimonadota bacterium]